MKPLIFGVTAFVVGLGGSVGVAVMKAPPHPVAAADSSAADSLRKAEPIATSPVSDTGHPPETTADTSSTRGRTSAAKTDTSAVAEVADYTNAVALDSPEQQAHRAQLYKRVARILIAMKPKDAAAILTQLNDDQLEGIFRALGVRQAAVMMAQIPAERAAEMSRRIIEESQGEDP